MHCMLKMQEVAHQVHKELLDQQVQVVQRGLQVQQAPLELQDYRESKAQQVFRGFLELLGLQGVTGPAGVTVVYREPGPPALLVSATNHDWYDAGTTSPPANINDDIYTNGNVGIGKNNPQTSLDVVGTATITNQTDGAVLLDLNTERNWQFKQLGTGATSSLELASINGGGNKNFVINTLGNVGVGTQTPQKKLDVSGNRADLLLKTTKSSAMNGDVLSSILFYNDDMSSGATGKRIGSGIRYRAQDDYGRVSWNLQIVLLIPVLHGTTPLTTVITP